MATVDPHGQRVDRERVLRTLTFWLRPEFVLRVVNRFQKVAGFDRAIALASGALTATIPLDIVASAVATQLGGKDTADRIIDRYELTGGGAEAVKDIFAPPTGSSTSLGIIGLLLPLDRGPELHPRRAAAVRADLGARPAERPQHAQRACSGSAGSRSTSLVSGLLHATLGRGRLELSAALLSVAAAAGVPGLERLVLSAKRIARQDLIPFAVLGVGPARGLLGRRDRLRPAPLRTYATRYGVIGAVFAMISALFCVMVVARRRPRRPAARSTTSSTASGGASGPRRRGPAPVGRGHRRRRGRAGRRCGRR